MVLMENMNGKYEWKISLTSILRMLYVCFVQLPFTCYDIPGGTTFTKGVHYSLVNTVLGGTTYTKGEQYSPVKIRRRYGGVVEGFGKS